MMNKLYQTAKNTFYGGLALLSLGCGAPTASGNHTDILRNATEIVIDEQVLNMGKDYDIMVNDEKVAIISGKNFRPGSAFVGDRFELTTLDGNLLLAEQERKRYLRWNRGAEFFSADNTTVGYLGEERISDLLRPGYIFHFYDADNNPIGKSQKIGKTAISLHNIYDAEGNVDYTIDKKFKWNPASGDRYIVSVKDPDSEIPLERVLMLVTIEDAIADSND